MKRLILIALIAIVGTSCSERLPRPTEKGKNTVGYKVDGEACVPPKQIFTALSSRYIYGDFSNDNTFHLGANCKSFGLIIYSPKITKTGNYNLLNRILLSKYYLSGNSYATNYYITNQQHTGTLTITRLDYDKQIISGTFEFEAVNTNDSTDVVKVTKGRFDIDFSTL